MANATVGRGSRKTEARRRRRGIVNDDDDGDLGLGRGVDLASLRRGEFPEKKADHVEWEDSSRRSNRSSDPWDRDGSS